MSDLQQAVRNGRKIKKGEFILFVNQLSVTLHFERVVMWPVKIDLKGLEEERSSFRYALDDAYFKAVKATQVKKGNLFCDLTICKSAGCYELYFHIEGLVTIPCDRCLEDMEQKICTDESVVVKFGEEPAEDGDVITISENEGIVDVSWLIYEFIVLDIPVSHHHSEGQCNAGMLKLLDAYQSPRNKKAEESKTDPRWRELERLKEKNNQKSE